MKFRTAKLGVPAKSNSGMSVAVGMAGAQEVLQGSRFKEVAFTVVIGACTAVASEFVLDFYRDWKADRARRKSGHRGT